MDLTERQWNTIKKFISPDPRRKDQRGRPGATNAKSSTGFCAPRKLSRPRYGAYQTVHRRFQAWRKAGVIEAVLQGLARNLDRSFNAPKKGALALARRDNRRNHLANDRIDGRSGKLPAKRL